MVTYVITKRAIKIPWPCSPGGGHTRDLQVRQHVIAEGAQEEDPVVLPGSGGWGGATITTGMQCYR
jgi:hypothetical protein